MIANVVPFFKLAPRPRDWNNQELAEFYRVEASLARSGLTVLTDRGLSEEGDPWFVFCHAETEDVIIHFARIDDLYVVASPAFNNCVRGRQFRPLIESLMESHPLVIAKPKDGGKLSIHPAALLVALVTTCYFKLGQTDAVAGETKTTKIASSTPAPAVTMEVRGGGEPFVLKDQAAMAVLTAIAIAVTWAEQDTVDTSATALGFVTWPADGARVGNANVAPAEILGLENAFSGLSHALAQSAAGSDTSADAGHALVFTTGHASTASMRLSLLKVADSDLTIIDNGAIIWKPEPQSAMAVSTFHSQHLALPVALSAEAAATAASTSETISLSAASQEILSILGASEQAHIIIALSADQQALITTASTSSSTTSSAADITTSTSSSATSSAADITTSTSSSATSSAAVTTTDDHAAASSTTTTASTSTFTTTTGPNSTSSTATHLTTIEVTASNWSLVDQAIVAFTTQHPDFQITKLGTEVIILDSHLTLSNVSTAVQELFTFQDGSSIFLIGLPATTTHSA